MKALLTIGWLVEAVLILATIGLFIAGAWTDGPGVDYTSQHLWLTGFITLVCSVGFGGVMLGVTVE